MERRPLGDVLRTGALTGLVAGGAAGLIDAVWSFDPAAQFVARTGARLRFVAYTGLLHALAGVLVGLVVTAIVVGIARGTRLGTLLGFAVRDHARFRARDPRSAVVGLSVVLAGVPTVATALYIAYRSTLPVVLASHAMGLAVLSVIASTLAALAASVVIAFVLARPIELGLAQLAPRVRAVSSVWAPFVALAVLVALGAALWAWREWETARILPLRGPAVIVLASVLALPAHRPARRLVELAKLLRPRIRPIAWIALPLLLLGGVLVAGGSTGVIKAASAYTGLGGPLTRTLRKAFDWDRDGYARFLGGGDCDDWNPRIHPGAPEIPDDGIDQNCVGGDATVKRSPDDVAFAPVPASVPKDFDVVLITIDTTRADHLHTYGYARPTSPNLDKLAADGTVFEHGWAHAPSTRYSMPAILTGRLPLDVDYDNSTWWPGISLKSDTIAKQLKARGFATGAITNYEYFDRKRHMDQGFDEYDNEDAKLHVQTGGPEASRGSSSKEQTDKAISFVDRHATDRFFLWVHYYDPHYAYEPHPGTPASWGARDIDLYDGEILFTDLHIGRLLDELRAKGLYDRTVVVVTGDHGEGFHEHKIDFHGFDLYAAQTKVPLIMRVPGLPARRAATPAGHVDILPTLVNLAGGAPSSEMMGQSLVDVLGGKDRKRVIFQQVSSERGEKRAGVDEACHVIYNVSPDPSWEVYDLVSDPLETRDSSGDDDACADTRRAFEHWYDRETIPKGADRKALMSSPPPSVEPLAELGTSIALLSLDVPAKAHPGDAIPLTWTFAAHGGVEARWKLFVHVEGPNQQVVANADHNPDWPFEWWEDGQFVRYTTTVTLPSTAPAGRYTVKVGLFAGPERHTVTAKRAKVEHGDEVAAATFEVGP